MEGHPMKMDPMPPRPTNRDLGDRILQVHDCQERHQAKNAASFRDLRRDVARIMDALHLHPGQKPTIAGDTSRKAFFRTVLATGTSLGALGGLTLGYRAVVALAPATWHWITVLNAAILSGKF
jgi:hypothetical protein